MGREFSAHLGYLFTEVPLEARFAEARRAGFDVVEHPAPFILSAAEVRARLEDNGLRMAQISSGPGGEGRKGLAALPGHGPAFQGVLCRALDYAEEIGCPLVHPMAGVPEAGTEPERCEGAWLENIGFATTASRDRPVRIFVEAISRATVPGYFLHRLDQYLSLTARLEVTPPVLVDAYHAAMNGEDAATFLRNHPERLAHVHVADAPGRHEPGTGSYDFRPLEAVLTEIGYSGSIGCEYIPKGDTIDGLAWRAAWPAC